MGLFERHQSSTMDVIQEENSPWVSLDGDDDWKWHWDRAASVLKMWWKRHSRIFSRPSKTVDTNVTGLHSIVVVDSQGIVLHSPRDNWSIDGDYRPSQGTCIADMTPHPVWQRRLRFVKEALSTGIAQEIDEHVEGSGTRALIFRSVIVPLTAANGNRRQAVIYPRVIVHETDHSKDDHSLPELLHSQEQERKKISLELHDGLCQMLTTLRLSIRSVQDGLRADQTELHVNCALALKTIQDAVEETRSIAMNLSPAALEDLGLRPAIRNLAAEVTRRSDILVSIIGLDSIPACHHRHDIHIYRIIQEALTNVARHSRATHAAISIIVKNGFIDVSISDNGEGFDVGRWLSGVLTAEHLGLHGMRERAKILSGSLAIRSSTELGTVVTLTVPIDHVSPNTEDVHEALFSSVSSI